MNSCEEMHEAEQALSQLFEFDAPSRSKKFNDAFEMAKRLFRDHMEGAVNEFEGVLQERDEEIEDMTSRLIRASDFAEIAHNRLHGRGVPVPVLEGGDLNEVIEAVGRLYSEVDV